MRSRSMKAVVGGFTQRSATTAVTVTSRPGDEREHGSAPEPRPESLATTFRQWISRLGEQGARRRAPISRRA